MGKVVFNMSMSLDGFVAGPNDGPENGLGDGGEGLFKWYFSGDTEISVGSGSPMLKVSSQSARMLKEARAAYGAGVWGRRTFDIAKGWGGHPPVDPAFIVTHTVPQEWVKKGSPFTFVTDGVESAIRQAKKAAGKRMLSSAPPVSCSNASGQAWLTKFISTWHPSCSAVASDCLTIWARCPSNWKGYARSRLPA